MLVGIHKNHKGSIQPFTQKYLDVLAYNDVPHLVIDIREEGFWDRFRTLDAFIFHIGQTSDILQMSGSFMPILQQFASIPIFPNYSTSWHFDDKIKQHYLAGFYDLKFVPAHIFWDMHRAAGWLHECKYPVVFKLKGGAGSTNVILVRDYRQAWALVKKAFTRGLEDNKLSASWRVKYFPLSKYLRNKLIHFKRTLRGEDSTPFWALQKNYVYFQDYIPGNEYDTRVTVIGNRAFAFRRFNRKGDFRASGSGWIDYAQDKAAMQMVKIAFGISRKCNFQSMAYDFLVNEDQPLICEMSFAYQDQAIYKCPGYWDDAFQWHEGHFMPQLLILEDLLRVSLKQPDWKL